MDQERFPQQEGDSLPPQEPEEETIQLTFSAPEETAPPPEETSERPEPLDDAAPLFEPMEDFLEPPPAPQAPPAEPEAVDTDAVDTDASSFMDRIPDTDTDYPALTTPQFEEEIAPDEHALRFHGMRPHGEEEPPLDMSFLEDPAFAPPPEEPEDEGSDQEYRDNGRGDSPPPEDPQARQTPSPRHRPVRKGRPKRKRSEWLFGIPNILSTVVWLALIVAIGVTAGRMLWVCAADVLAFGREDRAVTVTVYESDTMEDITQKLYDGGLIRYRSLFNLYASISNAQEDIKPGIYDLNTLYDYHALVNFMSPRSSREVVDVTIPEGYSCRQIFALLEEKRICTAVDVGAYAASGELDDYWFLEGVARGDKYCLEGYLFPDTYQFYKNSTPREALERMLDNFDVKFSEEMRQQLETLNADVTGGGYTVREVTTVASLIEKESAAPAESPRIAGVIYNRLFRWGDTPAYLNIDASIIYALDGKNDLTREDLQVDSPYNTYTHIGLPPTPISNPGLASLQAALSPENHDYYYYVLNPATGMHQFSRTYEEHSGYVAQFAQEQ